MSFSRVVVPDYGGFSSSPYCAIDQSERARNCSRDGLGSLRTDADETLVRVLLHAGDLLLMHGEARWQWMHGIDSVTADEWQGQTLRRAERVSITLRRLETDRTGAAEPSEP